MGRELPVINSSFKGPTYLSVIKEGLWDNNIVFKQLLALCPLLAVTTTTINGLGMGVASVFVLTLANLLVSTLRPVLAKQLRIPMFVIVIATLVTLVDLFMNAYVHDLHKVLGLFIPLIVTNCAVLGRAEAFASKSGVIVSTIDGFFMGIGFTIAMVMIGALREILGFGTLFAGASLLFGEAASFIELTVIPGYDGFLLSLLPPGGFIATAIFLALRQNGEAKKACVSCAS